MSNSSYDCSVANCTFCGGCGCGHCATLPISSVPVQARVGSATTLLGIDSKGYTVAQIEAYLKLKVIGLTSASFSATTTTAALGHTNLYACTDTSVPRTLTISSADITMGLQTVPWFFDVKDESGGAGTNKITIDTEGVELIDGVSSVEITADYGAIRLYSNGSNLFTR